MWRVENRTPFSAAGCFLRDPGGHEFWCVALRATFLIDSTGRITVAQEQDPVRMLPEFIDDNIQNLLAEEDFIPFSPVTDVTLTGTVVPPEGHNKPIPLHFGLGRIQKRLLLHPRRLAEFRRNRWRLAECTEHGPCTLDWRESFGGAETQDAALPPENPLGKGIELRQRAGKHAVIELPRIESPHGDCLADPHSARPVNFCPVPRWWRQRIQLAGTFNPQWQKNRAPLMPLDHDPRFACAGPLDQLPSAHLKGGEILLLQGFRPGADQRIRLPQIVFRAETNIGRSIERSGFHLARVDLDVSANFIAMIWLSTLACDGRDHLIDRSRISLQQMAGVW